MLSEIQLFAIGTVASALVWLLKISEAKIPAGWLTAFVYAVSAVLAFFFAPLAMPAFPPFGELAIFIPALLQWVSDLLVPLSAFVGFATLIYNALLRQVLEKYAAPVLMGSKKSKVKAKG